MRVLQLAFVVALASGLAAILIYITGVSNLNGTLHLSDEDLEALQSLQSGFQKCVSANGLGLQAVSGRDYCEVTLKFPSDTVPKWKDPKTGELEGLTFQFNLCEAVATWEQVRNSTTILTREFIEALPNGWEDYAWRRINKGVLLNHCNNKTLCMEKLSLVLPERPPHFPRQFGRCAVIGNSGDLLKTRFGKAIDSYDAVIRENGAPIQNYTEYVGTKSTFRLLNRGSAKALDKVAELYDSGKEVLIVKTTIHDIMNKMIREVPILNPVYLMLGASFGSAAKGTGLKALEFALSLCDTVDMYGFTVDPGYKEWTRYFSESRQGHTPLHGRAYYQMMECLGDSFSMDLMNSCTDGTLHLSDEDLEALQSLQSGFQKCVSANGLGLQAVSGRDYCEVTLKFPSDTVPKWKDPKTGELEGLTFQFNLCEAVATWEQNYTEYVGTKSTFRLLNRGSAKALDKVAELYDSGKEVLIVKTTIHDIMNKMIREVPILNPVYLMLGASFGSAAKGTGLKALEFALSLCDTVDMYGFTVDPGYKEWTRYFSESRQGHTPLHGRAYYQMMECLGVHECELTSRAHMAVS
ncbi:unnamed protein product [Ilex paraguariensis]|uniref:Sialyltransferase-like protein 2 n=1 Tax=Ilex paraguariensis TaxID=185542 RepID=A0ABC8UB00_9AQUA